MDYLWSVDFLPVPASSSRRMRCNYLWVELSQGSCGRSGAVPFVALLIRSAVIRSVPETLGTGQIILFTDRTPGSATLLEEESLGMEWALRSEGHAVRKNFHSFRRSQVNK